MSTSPQQTPYDVRAFAEQILIDRIFMGDYQEKRYVAKLNVYKDLIVLNKDENILVGDLIRVKNQILSNNLNTWYGFTEPCDIGTPAAAYCIWTSFDETNGSEEATSVVFGEYWFQIKSIRLKVNVMEICVEVLRPIDSMSSMSSSSAISSFTKQALEIDRQQIQQYVQENIIEADWIMLFNQWKTSINQMAYHFISTEINWSNLVHCIQLLGMFGIAFVKMCVHFVHCIGEFTLRLISELTKLIKASTPIVLAILNLFSKMIGGLYILFAMIWRDLFYGDSSIGKNGPNSRNSYSFNGRAPITYRENPRPFLQSSFSRRSSTGYSPNI